MKQPFKVGDEVWFLNYNHIYIGIVLFALDYPIEILIQSGESEYSIHPDFIFRTSAELLDFIKQQIKNLEK